MLPPEPSTNKLTEPNEPRDSLAKPSDFKSPADVTINVSALPSSLRDDLESAPFWLEVDAFANMPLGALDPYDGKFIAIYKGNIVDSDRDEGKLALRFYQTFGYVPVYIHKVGVEDDVVHLLV